VTLRPHVAVVALLCALSSFVGCKEPPPDAADPNRKLRIAVIPKGTTHEFWKSVHHGALRAAKELDVEIIWKGAVNESSREAQINIVQDFINAGVDGICLAPISKDSLIPPVQQAKQAGIPTVIFDSGLDDTESIVSYVATDNEKGGRLGAQCLAEAMGKKGNVILLRYAVGSESTQLREEGFLDELKKYPDIKVLSENQYSGTTRDSSLDVCQRLFLQYRDQVNGVFVVAEPNGVGMLNAMKSAQLDGKIKFVGFDPSPTLIEAMAQGIMHGIVLQDPDTMGYLAVKTLVKSIRGEKVEKRVSTGEYVATPENMNSPEMKKLLFPPQQEE
jgi:ribose transport system substrate-binding protein